MFAPEPFVQSSQTSEEAASTAYKRYGHLIKWKSGGSSTILDVGCGPGNVLVDNILPLFDGKFSRCFATDLSEEMIDFAIKRYGHLNKMKFLKLDIMGEVDDYLEQHKEVDHAISTFALHFLSDLETGLRNIFKLLKSGGDVFAVFVCDAAIFHIYEYMVHNERWNHFFDDLQQCIPVSVHSKQPLQDLRDQMKRSGFEDIFVDIFPQETIFPSYDSLLLLFSSVHAKIQHIPEEMRNEYIKEFVDYGIDKSFFVPLPSGELKKSLKIFVAYGRKPE